MADDWARPVVHWELYANDVAALRAFYRAMFNWNIGEGPIATVDAGIGAPEPDGFTGHILPGARGFVLDVQVRDLKESLARAVELGGSVVAQPFDVPNGPTIAAIADPEGNRVTLVQQ